MIPLSSCVFKAMLSREVHTWSCSGPLPSVLLSATPGEGRPTAGCGVPDRTQGSYGGQCSSLPPCEWLLAWILTSEDTTAIILYSHTLLYLILTRPVGPHSILYFWVSISEGIVFLLPKVISLVIFSASLLVICIFQFWVV